jgi:hypothetical protein
MDKVGDEVFGCEVIVVEHLSELINGTCYLAACQFHGRHDQDGAIGLFHEDVAECSNENGPDVLARQFGPQSKGSLNLGLFRGSYKSRIH